MSENFKEKLKTIGFNRRQGSSRRFAVKNERDGSTAGFQVEHWDGRVDDVVTPTPSRAALKRKDV